MQPDLFIVTKEGIYRHDIVGVYESEALAREAAERSVRAEPDDYHDFYVIATTLNGGGERLVVKCQRKTTWDYFAPTRRAVSVAVSFKQPGGKEVSPWLR